MFLHRGDVHIIPKPRTPGEVRDYPVATPTLERALELVRSEEVTTRANPRVQECIKLRIARCVEGGGGGGGWEGGVGGGGVGGGVGVERGWVWRGGRKEGRWVGEGGNE